MFTQANSEPPLMNRLLNISVPPEGFKFSSTESNDVFLHAECLSNWRQEYVQLGGGKFSGYLVDCSVGPIQIFREQMNQPVDEAGMPKPDSYVIGVPVEVRGEGHWGGDPMVLDSLISLSPNQELKFRTPDTSDIYVAVVDKDVLESHMRNIEDADIRIFNRMRRTQPTDHQSCEIFRQYFKMALSASAENPALFAAEAARKIFLNFMLEGICRALAGIRLTDLPITSRVEQKVHRHMVGRAKDLILSRAENPPTVTELCMFLGVSRRTLHYGFQKVLGINPVSYIRCIRLNGVRRDLIAAEPTSSTITDVASRWGFWHLGMFSNYYKALFGEVPSFTLKHKPSVNQIDTPM